MKEYVPTSVEQTKVNYNSWNEITFKIYGLDEPETRIISVYIGESDIPMYELVSRMTREAGEKAGKETMYEIISIEPKEPLC